MLPINVLHSVVSFHFSIDVYPWLYPFVDWETITKTWRKAWQRRAILWDMLWCRRGTHPLLFFFILFHINSFQLFLSNSFLCVYVLLILCYLQLWIVWTGLDFSGMNNAVILVKKLGRRIRRKDGPLQILT
jgi:hypothetical protein